MFCASSAVNFPHQGNITDPLEAPKLVSSGKVIMVHIRKISIESASSDI